MSDRALPPVRRERADVAFRSMLGLFALILGVLLVLLGLAYWLFPKELADRHFTTPFPRYPSPVLQPNPQLDMDAFRAEEMHALNTAGWKDRAAGIAHIPIRQAMEQVAREGIAGWPTKPAPGESDRR